MEKNKLAQLPAVSSIVSGFSDIRLINKDQGPGLAGAQSVKRGHEEELDMVVKGRKDGNSERVKLETAPDLISFH
jgi:hypothetical protein